MTSTETAVTRPAGTRALLYAALSLVTTVGWWVVVRVLAEITGWAWGAIGVALAAVSVPVALVVALIRRLTSDRPEMIRLQRVALVAVGAPVALSVAFGLLEAALRFVG